MLGTTSVSSTVDKALELMNVFSQSRPELGLSELARIATLDKATVHRMLGTLAKHGFVEQDVHSKLYRLGAAPLRYARIRESSFPTAALIDPILQQLAEETGETCHASLIAGGGLATVGVVPGKRALHVTLDAGERLPYHATASGIVCLAFLPERQLRAVLAKTLSPYTDQTEVTPDLVLQAVTRSRQMGYAFADQTYEADVCGIAAPIFDGGGHASGAVAVATPASRMTRDVKAHTIKCALSAAIRVTQSLGAEPPAHFLALVRKAAA